MQQEKLWILIASRVTGEASEKDLLELDYFLRGNEKISSQVKLLEQIWQMPAPVYEQVPAMVVEKLLLTINAPKG